MVGLANYSTRLRQRVADLLVSQNVAPWTDVRDRLSLDPTADMRGRTNLTDVVVCGAVPDLAGGPRKHGGVGGMGDFDCPTAAHHAFGGIDISTGSPN